MKIIQWIKTPKRFFGGIMLKLSPFLPDKLYLSCMMVIQCGRRMNWKNPQRFTEKLQWLKLYNRRPEYTMMVDKFAVKSFIADRAGIEYVIPTYGVWENVEQIEWDKLPNQFVLKTTHSGGNTGVIICKDKDSLNKRIVEKKLSQSLKTDTYKLTREWPYKNVQRRIIAEPYLEDEYGELRDYKFYCFNGEPRVMLVASNRNTSHNFDYFDLDKNHLPIVSTAGPNAPSPVIMPESFDSMKRLARKLSEGLPHVRVDLYSVKNHIFFGEMTFFDSSGYDNMSSDKWDLMFGSWLTLPEKNN